MIDPSKYSDRRVATYITFDKYATFELRYQRYRRADPETGEPLPYLGECDEVIHKRQRLDP